MASAQAFVSAQLFLAFSASISFPGTSGYPLQPQFTTLLPQLKPQLSRMARWALRPNSQSLLAKGSRCPVGCGVCDMLILHPVEASQFSFVFLLLSPSVFPPPVHSSVFSFTHTPFILVSITFPPSYPPSAMYHAHTLGFSNKSSPSVMTSKHTNLRQWQEGLDKLSSASRAIWKALLEELTF